MKQILVLSLIALIWSCKTESQHSNDTKSQVDTKTIADITDESMSSGVIYEANIRQYSPEGTFNAFTKDMPRLKDLGVKFLWLMPIHPISVVKRKASGDVFASEIEDTEEREKYLGSYYSVADYKAVNPEFGTLEDFEHLIDVAHENGIYVIIDWVPNHTGWDHPWISDHPDWYTQNEKGEILDPLNPETGKSWGWTDVADLNYDNVDMRKEMIADMAYWTEDVGIDGFRVDVAHGVPTDFFEAAISELESDRPLFMLAEAEKHDLFEAGFDMQYAWKGHHLLNDIAKGHADANDFRAYMSREDSLLVGDDFNMNFVTNHDENSWNGTLAERMPNNKEFFTALTYVIPGMPLIYSGQEYDMDHRLKFFEKDEIPKTKGEYFDFLVKLGKLKNSSIALSTGELAASYKDITSNPAVIAFRRDKEDETIVFVGNVSTSAQQLADLPTGQYQDYLSDTEMELTSSGVNLEPWEYKILIKKQ